MPLICLEGASGVGKSTTALEIVKRTNAYIIPEVNLLFERPSGESNTWYMERQVDRWMMAQDKLKTYDTVILDGDIFHPFSYNWCFNFEIFNQNLELIADFYRKALKEHRIGFPEKYFYLYSDNESLRYRKNNDLTRKRSNFEKHLSIVGSYSRYYNSLNEFLPHYVHFIEANQVDENVNSVLENLNSTTNLTTPLSTEFLEEIINWLSTNKAFNTIPY